MVVVVGTIGFICTSADVAASDDSSVGTSVVVIGTVAIICTSADVATSDDSSVGTSVVVVVATIAFICTSFDVVTSDDFAAFNCTSVVGIRWNTNVRRNAVVVVVVGTIAFTCTSADVATSDDSSICTSIVIDVLFNGAAPALQLLLIFLFVGIAFFW